MLAIICSFALGFVVRSYGFAEDSDEFTAASDESWASIMALEEGQLA